METRGDTVGRGGSDVTRRELVVGATVLAMLPFPVAAEPGRNEKQMLADWPWLGRYAAENEALKANGAKIDAVFMGDSISEFWKLRHPAFFPESWVMRGISGQTSGQMVLRMMADVVALRPRVVHILAGTNDVAGNTGSMTPQMTIDNIAAMAEIANAHRIGVLIGAILPVDRFYWNPTGSPAGLVKSLNRSLKTFAANSGFRFIDYHAAMTDANGGLPRTLAEDGVHPNAQGYAVMEALVRPVVSQALKKTRRAAG
jgi:lysophospholipase L1-like esterase